MASYLVVELMILIAGTYNSNEMKISFLMLYIQHVYCEM